LNLLENENSAGVFSIDDALLSILMRTQSSAIFFWKTLKGKSTLSRTKQIQQAASRTKGAAGPSNLDAENWRRMLLSKACGSYSTDLVPISTDFGSYSTAKSISIMTRIL